MNKQIRQISSFILILFIWSCSGDKKQSELDTTVDIAIPEEPKMINPFINPTSDSREIYQYLFIPMADFDPVTYELTPILIKSIPEGEEILEGPYKGGTKYTIEFREDAKWDNGEPVTAKDLLFSIKAIKHPGVNAASYRSYIDWISDAIIDSTNNRKIDLYFKDYYMLAKEAVVTLQVYPEYFYDPTSALSTVSFNDLSGDSAKAVVDADSSLIAFAEAFNSVKFSRETFSNVGPYMITDWVTNQIIVLEKKKDYWAKDSKIWALQAFPEKIIFHIIPEETVAVTQMKEGNIDLNVQMSSDMYFDLKENETYGDQFEFMTTELMKFYYIAINNTKPELADPDVRRALAKLTDVNKLIELLEDGLGTQTVGIFNSKKPYYNSDLKAIELDIAGAKAILEGKGWKDTNNDGTIDKSVNGQQIEMDLDFYITGSELSENVALLLQENAKQVGIKINIITKGFAELKRDNLKKREYDLVPLSLTQDLALDDPYTKWHSDNDDPSKSNDVGYRSKKADDLIDNIRSARDDKSRNAYYMELQKVMYDDQPVIFLYNPTEKLVLNKKWKGTATLKRPGYMANTFIPQ